VFIGGVLLAFVVVTVTIGALVDRRTRRRGQQPRALHDMWRNELRERRRDARASRFLRHRPDPHGKR